MVFIHLRANFLFKAHTDILLKKTLEFVCANPESFVRGGPNHLPASETPFRWCFAGMPMMAQH